MLKDRVAASIRTLYPAVDTDHLIESGDRVTGYVVDEQFKDVVQGNGERMQRIWDRLRTDLGEEAVHVGVLLFLTRADVESYAAAVGGQT